MKYKLLILMLISSCAVVINISAKGYKGSEGDGLQKVQVQSESEDEVLDAE